VRSTMIYSRGVKGGKGDKNDFIIAKKGHLIKGKQEQHSVEKRQGGKGAGAIKNPMKGEEGGPS